MSNSVRTPDSFASVVRTDVVVNNCNNKHYLLRSVLVCGSVMFPEPYICQRIPLNLSMTLSPDICATFYAQLHNAFPCLCHK